MKIIKEDEKYVLLCLRIYLIVNILFTEEVKFVAGDLIAFYFMSEN